MDHQPFWHRDWFHKIAHKVTQGLNLVLPHGSWPSSPTVSSQFCIPITARRSEVFIPASDHMLSVGRDTLRSLQIGFLGAFARFWIEYLNETKIYDLEKLHHAVYHRGNVGLVTVSNHNSELDDPCVIASLCRTSILFDSKYMRWVFCAADVCFKNAVSTAFFGNGKGLPLRRGGGLDQPEMTVAVEKVNKGEWIHIFPEGRVFQGRDGKMGQMRPGVGKLIADPEKMPLVLPFYHLGMEKVRPIGRGPQKHHQVRVIVGDPINLADIIKREREAGSTDMEVYRAIARRIGVELEKLHVELRDRMSDGKVPDDLPHEVV